MCCTAGAVELRNEIGHRVGCDLPGTLVFDYPTVAAISAYLADRLAPAQLPDASSQAAAEAVPQTGLVAAAQVDRQLVLVTGIRSRLAQLPGSKSLPVAAAPAADPICPVLHDRWDADFGRSLASFGSASRLTGTSSAAGVLSGRFGGCVLEWAAFDPEAFAIPPSGEPYVSAMMSRILLRAASCEAESYRDVHTVLPLPVVLQRRRCWTRSSACCWRRLPVSCPPLTPQLAAARPLELQCSSSLQWQWALPRLESLQLSQQARRQQQQPAAAMWALAVRCRRQRAASATASALGALQVC